MPTPSSSHTSDPSRTHPFASTCPEDQAAQPPSPSSWHPLPPPPYSSASPVVSGLPPAAQRGAASIESPQSVESLSSSRSSSRSGEPHNSEEIVVIEAVSATTDDEDDARKTIDIDEDMTRLDEGSTPVDSRGDDAAAAALPSMSPHRQHHQHDGVFETQSSGASPRRRKPLENTSASADGVAVSPWGDAADYGDDIEMQYGWDASRSIAGNVFSQLRVIPTTPSSYLRPGSRFYGTQQSERQVYDVQVEIKHVDLRESFLCGYLRIQGLTEDHPTLTTYFEGEIIGPKYTFITNHESWGANDKTDLTHWSKFPSFRPFAKAVKKGNAYIKDVAQREHIFMRWKEHFLVPDHRVRTINGASFEGFYYICFNQIRGDVTGIYFHSKSEKFQQLELKHVEDKGCFSAVEFR